MKKFLIFTFCFLLAGNSALSFADDRSSWSPAKGFTKTDNNNSSGGKRESHGTPPAPRPSASAPRGVSPQPARHQVSHAGVSNARRASQRPSSSNVRQNRQPQAVVRRENQRPSAAHPARSAQAAHSSPSPKAAVVRNESRHPQRRHSNVEGNRRYDSVQVTRRHNDNRRIERKTTTVSIARSAANPRTSVEVSVGKRDSYFRPSSHSGRNNAARSIAAVLFFPFSLAFGSRHHSSIYVSRPYYHHHYYPYYDYPYYYSSSLYYSPYWWQSSPDINYNTYNNYTYVQNDSNAQTRHDAEVSDAPVLENIKLQGARYIDNPKSVALTITNETQYALAGVVFTLVFRGEDFTEIIENVHYNFDVPLQEYEKKFARLDLSGVEFQTPEAFSVVAVVQSATTADGLVIAQERQTPSDE
jgi:hypothetical protein